MNRWRITHPRERGGRRLLSTAIAGAVILLLSFQNPAQAVAGDISTFAGRTPGHGDGGPATAAQLDTPAGVIADAAGNFYVADQANHKIRKVDSGGTITTYAGNGNAGYSGDGGAATAAEMNFPSALSIDSAGNLYIADPGNHVVRKVDTAGIITTFAGTGTAGFSGDGGQATSARLSSPSGVAVDVAGNVFISDTNNNRIRRVNSSGVISTFAGTGTPGALGDGGPATSAQLDDPRELALNGAGQLFIADSDNHKIRRVSSGTITTFAGTGVAGSAGDSGAATAAQLNNPQGVAIDAAGNVFIADVDNSKIRRVDISGLISKYAGTGSPGFSGDGGPAGSAQLDNPVSVAIDSSGRLLIADSGNDRVRRVSTGGTITTVAGSGLTSSGDGGPATNAVINMPISVTRDSAGNFYIAEFGGHKIRKITPGGIISTVAGNGTPGSGGDGGPATSAQLNQPADVEVDSAGNLIIADYQNNKIRQVTPAGIISTIVGTGAGGGPIGDGGPPTSARLRDPVGVGFDAAGDLVIADSGHDRVRKVSGGIITTVAGTGTAGSAGDGGPATAAQLNAPLDIDHDSAGSYLISDYNNHKIRKVDASGMITTVAGTGIPGFSGDGGPATSAGLWQPIGVTWDSIGNFFIADSSNNRIRKVNTSGAISTVAGTGVAGFSGDGGPATAARLNFPARVVFDPSGNFYLADFLNDVIRKVEALGGVGPPTFTATNPPSPSNDNNPRVLGTAEAGTTVRLYTNPTCTSAVAATGTDAEFSSPGLSVAVADNSTTTVYATATDGFGNVSLCSTNSITYVEDSVSPGAPSITSTPPEVTDDETPTWSFTGESGATFSCELREGASVTIPFASCTSAHEYNLTLQSDATYTFVVTQTDDAGNTGPEATDTFTLDRMAPAEPTITGVPPDPSNDETPTWTFSGDGSSTLRCELTRGVDVISAYADCLSPKEYNLTLEADGVYTFKVKQVDAGSNESPEASDSFTLDTAAPAPPTFSGSDPASPANDNSPLLTGSAEAGSTVRLFSDSVCSSAIAGIGGSATFASPGIGASVAGDTSTTFYATATDAAGNISACSSSSITYVEDSTVPAAPTFTSTSPISPANDNSPSIGGTAEAGSTVSLFTDSSCLSAAGSGSAASFASPGIAVLVGDDSTTTFWANAVDLAGNTSACSSSSIAYVEDSTAPAEPTFTGTMPPSPANENNPLIQGSAEAGSVVSLFTDSSCSSAVAGTGSAATFASPGIAVSVPDDSTTTFYATAKDAAGNSSACSTASITYVEASAGAPSAPVITLSPTSPGSDVTPTWEFTGDAGATFDCELRRGLTTVFTLAACSSPHTYSLVAQPNGDYTFRVRATVGGISGPFSTSDYTFDTAAPAPPSITAAPSDPTNDETPSWSFTGEPGGTFACELRDGGGVLFAFAPCTTGRTYNLTAEADGGYTFAVRQIDDAGNTGAEATDDFALDTTDPAPPTLTVLPPDPGSDQTPEWEFTGEAGATFECELRDGAAVLEAFATCSSPHSFDLTARPDDTYTFAVRQTDLANNLGLPVADNYTLDTSGSSVSLTAVPPDPDNDATPEWEFTGEVGATFECQLSLGGVVLSAFADCTSPHTYDLSSRPDGTYTLAVRSKDPVGNVGPEVIDDYSFDSTPPAAASIDSTPGTTGNDTTPTWAFSGEAGAVFQCQLNRGATVVFAAAPCLSPRTFDLSSQIDAVYTFTVLIADAAGNSGPPATSDYTLDTVPPSAPTFTSTPSSPDTDSTPSWAFTSEAGATFECQLLSGSTIISPFAPCSSPATPDLSSLPDGSYVFSVRAVDAAGNLSTPTTDSYVYDGPPLAPVFTSLPEASTDATPTWGFAGEPGMTFECQLSKEGVVVSGFSACSTPTTFDLTTFGGGSFVFSVRAVDAFGRHGPAANSPFTFSPPPPPPQGAADSEPLAGLVDEPDETAPAGGGTAPAVPARKAGGEAQAVGSGTGDELAPYAARILTTVTKAVQFPMFLLLIVVIFLLVQDRIDKRDPKLQFIPKLDPDLGFLPPPSKAG